MSGAGHLPEEELGELLALLRSAPVSWVEAAQELPHAPAGLGDIDARLHADRHRARHPSV